MLDGHTFGHHTAVQAQADIYEYYSDQFSISRGEKKYPGTHSSGCKILFINSAAHAHDTVHMLPEICVQAGVPRD